MARPWQLDIRVQCPHCVRTMDVTVELRGPTRPEPKAMCPYCNAVLLPEPRVGLIVSIGRCE